MVARLLGLLAALVALACGFWAASRDAVVNPHGFMSDESRCSGCHRVERQGQDSILDPHIFTRSVVEICHGCHPAERMGRSHPVGTDPRRSKKYSKLPPELPLQLVEGERTEVMTCGTCHNPHLSRLSQQRLFPRQPVHPGTSNEYLTYYLRIRPQNPRDGFTALCHACHPNL